MTKVMQMRVFTRGKRNRNGCLSLNLINIFEYIFYFADMLFKTCTARLLSNLEKPLFRRVTNNAFSFSL